MNFSTIEDSVLKKKKKFINFLSCFFKNSRILIILFTAAVVTAVSISIWIKSPEYQILYNNLSNEDGGAIINELNQMQIPYRFTDVSGQISVPKNKVYEIRLHLAENNLPKNGIVGFELLDQSKFGISQFNEKINYQRALEGELSRTIKRIKIVKNARIHLAFPESSLFLQNKKTSSASVILELKTGYKLNVGQINAILHLISTSIPNLPIKNITIVDQFSNLLNDFSLQDDQINNIQLKYSEDVENRYQNRIKNILEPLVGVGNVYAQVTAQIDFNSQEHTQEQYAPNSHHDRQAIRSHQISIHDEIQNNIPLNTPHSVSNFAHELYKKNDKKVSSVKNKKNFKSYYNEPVNKKINRDKITNYELNHSILHTKINVGEVKRLSAAVIVNYIKDKNGNRIPLTSETIKNLEKLTREAIGFSQLRGDSVAIVNTSFFKYDNQLPIATKNLKTFKLSNFVLTFTPWFFSFLFLCVLLKKYFCPISKKNNFNNLKISAEEQNIQKINDLEKDILQLNNQKNLNLDQLINQISNISNQNPRTIALIIREWMSDKI